MKKFDIRKTFEIFWTEPLSIFAKGLFQLVNIEDNIFSKCSGFNVDFVNNQTQITVVNNPRLYQTFQSVLVRHKMKSLKEKVAR